MIRRDLETARNAWIAEATTAEEKKKREGSDFLTYRTRDGKVADFHALRHTFITNLVNAGVQPKNAKELARHSTITLTMDRYSHVRHSRYCSTETLEVAGTRRRSHGSFTGGRESRPMFAVCTSYRRRGRKSED